MIKDGKGNIIIDEKTFELLLSNDIDTIIKCKKILYQKYIFYTIEDGYYLCKRYENQENITEWSGNDVGLVYELFKDTRIKYKTPTGILPLDGTESIMEGPTPIGKNLEGWIIYEPEPRPWLIEISMRSDSMYLTISEDGHNNRPWKQEEINMIDEIFNKTRFKKLERILK